MRKGTMYPVKASVAALGVPQRSEDERSEAERSGGTPKAAVPLPPDPEVLEIRKRRRFTSAYKASVVQPRRRHGCVVKDCFRRNSRRGARSMNTARFAPWRMIRAGFSP